MYIYEQIFLNIAILIYTAVIKFYTYLFERYRSSYHSVIIFIITYYTSYTVKPVISSHSKIYKMKVLLNAGEALLMWSILQYF